MMTQCNHTPSQLFFSIWTWSIAFAMGAFCFLMISSTQVKSQTSQPSASEKEIVILALGDSLTAGYMLPADKSFPSQLQAALIGKGYHVRVLNAGVSGDTTADGLARLDWSLNEKIDAAIVELGANDGLRGSSVAAMEKNLSNILKQLKYRHLALLLAGMEAPRNWGQDYAKAFRGVYPKLASQYDCLLYPFFLKDVAGSTSLNLSDGLHPTPQGVGIIVDNIMPDVEKLIAQVKQGQRSQ